MAVDCGSIGERRTQATNYFFISTTNSSDLLKARNCVRLGPAACPASATWKEKEDLLELFIWEKECSDILDIFNPTYRTIPQFFLAANEIVQWVNPFGSMSYQELSSKLGNGKNIFRVFMCVTICTYVGESQIFSKWKKLDIRRPFFIPGFIYRRNIFPFVFFFCFFFFILFFFGWSLNRLPLGTLVLDPSFTPDSVLSWRKCAGFPFAAL